MSSPGESRYERIGERWIEDHRPVGTCDTPTWSRVMSPHGINTKLGFPLMNIGCVAWTHHRYMHPFKLFILPFLPSPLLSIYIFLSLSFRTFILWTLDRHCLCLRNIKEYYSQIHNHVKLDFVCLGTMFTVDYLLLSYSIFTNVETCLVLFWYHIYHQLPMV